jgi:hypothetical protein
VKEVAKCVAYAKGLLAWWRYLFERPSVGTSNLDVPTNFFLNYLPKPVSQYLF